MKDTILNSTLVASLFVSVLFGMFDTSKSTSPALEAASVRVVQMEKTVVTAKRLAPEMKLAIVDEKLAAVEAR